MKIVKEDNNKKSNKKISLEFEIIELEKKLAPNEASTPPSGFPQGEGAEC